MKLEPTPLRALPKTEAVEAFTRGAEQRTATPAGAGAGDDLDPNAPASKGINVRLNEYELALIRRLSDLQDRSMQKVIKRVLVPALLAEIERLSDS